MIAPAQELRMRTPHDNLCAAIGIIQAHILAADSMLCPDALFGRNYLNSSGLEAAVALLMSVTDEAGQLSWLDEQSVTAS